MDVDIRRDLAEEGLGWMSTDFAEKGLVDVDIRRDCWNICTSYLPNEGKRCDIYSRTPTHDSAYL